MTTEEKAQAYDEALKVANKYKDTHIMFPSIKDEMFPELKESEDERIRKALISLFKSNDTEYFGEFTNQQFVAWLEKQGEKTVDKLQVSDELYEHIRNTCACIDDALSSKTLDDINDYLSMADRSAQSAFDMIELRGKETTDNDIKEALRTEYEKGRADAIAEVQNPAWSEEDENMLNSIIATCELAEQDRDSSPARHLFEMQTDWLKSLKDRVQPIVEWKHENTGDLTDFENAMMHIGESFFSKNAGLNPNDTNTIKEQANILAELVQSSKEWSEEDEEMLEDVKFNFEYNKGEMTDAMIAQYNRFFDKIKSLKPQAKPVWSAEDEKKRTLLIDILKVNYPNDYFKVNPVNTLNMEAMPTEELVSWLESIKDRVLPQPTHEWSEEDEKLINSVIELIGDGALDRDEKDYFIEKIESLKQEIKGE